MKHYRLLLVVTLLLLFSVNVQAKNIQTAIVKELISSGNSWDGTLLPAYPTGGPVITILNITVPPGAQLPVHKHPVINAGVLLKGTLKVVTKDGKILHLQAGDPIIEVVDTWHYGKNEGTDPAEIIVFYAGTTGSPLSIKEKN